MSDIEWRTQQEIRLRAKVICRDRDPGSPVCTGDPCSMCLDEAKREHLRELEDEVAQLEDRTRLLSARMAAIHGV